MKKNRLLLHTKNDVPFIEAQVNIHQPTIDEISLIGEDNFQVGVRFIGITKDEIDSLFNDTTTSESVTKEEIDNLFEDAPGASSEETYGTVSFAEIDSLFD